MMVVVMMTVMEHMRMVMMMIMTAGDAHDDEDGFDVDDK